MRGAVLALTAGLMASAAVAAVPGLEPGVSRELAQWRAKYYRDIRYALAISVTAGASKLTGTGTVEVTLGRSVPDLVLDWRPTSGGSRVAQLRVNGKPAKAKLEREHLIVPARLLRAGRNRITLSFESPIALSGSAVTRYVDREDGSEYVYTLFVPSDASSAFPCFDQPDLKARFRLDLVLPRAWIAVGNAPIAATEDVSNGLRRFRFAATPPISTYLFAFAAGPFAEVQAPASPQSSPAWRKTARAQQAAKGRPGSSTKEKAVETRLFVRKSQLARARTEAPEVLRLNRESVRWFERYFDSRFPFPKYDLVLVPEFAYGGMEHAGATFLREEAVLFPSTPNETDILARAQLLFHETSHQWFGDLVTMRWFDDLWLKEGFANFMAAKAAEALLPAHSVWNAFHALKTGAYRTDVTQGTTPIYRPLANLSAAKSVYGNIVYGKAPSVLRQAEFDVGARVFRRAVRQFLKAHAYAAADWNDLVASLERASGRKLKRWAEAWVKRRGMPEVRLAWDTDRDGRPKNTVLEQHNVLDEAEGVRLVRERASPLGRCPVAGREHERSRNRRHAGDRFRLREFRRLRLRPLPARPVEPRGGACAPGNRAGRSAARARLRFALGIGAGRRASAPRLSRSRRSRRPGRARPGDACRPAATRAGCLSPLCVGFAARRSGGTLRATSRGGDAARGHTGTPHHFPQDVHGERLVGERPLPAQIAPREHAGDPRGEAQLARPLPHNRAAARARRPGGEGSARRADRRGFRRRRPPLRLRRRRCRAQRRGEARLLRAFLQRAGPA